VPGEQGVAAQDVFVIHNPAAGVRHPHRLRRRVEAELTKRGVRYSYAFTQAPGHARALAAGAVAAGFRRVLVAGGDGTVHEAVSALVDSDATLALLPVGTGNQLAANLGLPRRLMRSLDVALSGDVRRIDVGLIDGRPFACIAGAGFDANIVRPDSGVKRRLGYLAYVHAAAAAAVAPRPSKLRILIDGEEFACSGIGVEVVNMPGLTAPWLPRPVAIVPDGRADDGFLEVFVLAVETTTDFISAMTSIVTRRFGRNHRLQYYRGREIFVEADPPLPVQADGERLGMTPFEVRVRPGALRVVVPRAAAGAVTRHAR
jgi:YegS/Rv2252/BmrU family lipid kinase